MNMRKKEKNAEAYEELERALQLIGKLLQEEGVQKHELLGIFSVKPKIKWELR